MFLVRHGATIWHAENRYAGSSDVALSNEGLAQAQRLGEWASAAKLTSIWCSPLSRAISTATPAANATGLKPLTIDPRLRELDFGEVEGLTIAEAEKRFREPIQRFRADPERNPMPGGEDPRNAAARAIEVLYDIAGAHPQGRVLVVSHNTLIRLALCSLLGIPLARYRAIFPGIINCALTEIRFRDREVALLRYNSDLPPIVKHKSSEQTQ